MGKSEVDPVAPVSDSASSSSDSEPENATEAMEETTVCDGAECTAGDSKAPGDGEEAGGERNRSGPGSGPGGRGGRRFHPRAVFMRPRSPPPHVIMHFMRHGTPSPGPAGPCGPAVCPVGPSGPAHGPRGFKCGPPRGGPFMKKRFWKHIIPNPEFWQRMSEKYAQDGLQDGPQDGPQDEADLAEDFSEMEVNGKHQEKWRRFLQHMFEEMNLHAPTESEGAEGNLTDECSKETKQHEATQDEKKVHFGGFLMNAGPGNNRRWHRAHHRHHGPNHAGTHHHGPHHYGPHHHGHPGSDGHPGMMFRGPRAWMFRHMMMNQLPRDDDKSGSDGETPDQGASSRRQKSREQRREFRRIAREMGWIPRRWGIPGSDSEAENADEDLQEGAVRQDMRSEIREKRTRFRETVREIGVRPWMFKILAEEMSGKKLSEETKEKDVEITGDADQKQVKEQKEKYLQILKEIGAYPWMFRVLANQQSRYASKDSPREGAEAAPEKGPGRCERRKMFRKMAQQMGWTSDSEVTSDGEALTDGEGEKKEEKERRRGERQKMRRVMREMGWMPLMMMGRGHHRHHDNPDGGAPHGLGGRHHPHHSHARGKHSRGKHHH